MFCLYKIMQCTLQGRSLMERPCIFTEHNLAKYLHKYNYHRLLLMPNA